MFCKTCGNRIDADSMFCSFCGAKQSDVNKPIVNEIDLQRQGEPKAVNLNLSFGPRNKTKPMNEINESKQSKFVPTYTPESDAFFSGVILVLIYLVYAISGPINFESYESYNRFNIFVLLGAVVLRVFVTIWIVAIAKRQNRETFGWGVLAFLVPSIALIIIGLQKKIFPKFEINASLSNEESSQILCGKAVAFLDNKKYNESIRFAEKAIELNTSNELAFATLTKARLEMPVTEIANKQTQIVYRQTRDNKILKIVSKRFQTIGAEVFIADILAPDGEYAYLNDNKKLIVRNGKIEKMLD